MTPRLAAEQPPQVFASFADRSEHFIANSNTTLMPPEPLHTFRVSSAMEAVELAERFKVEGRYNWFRGQREAWRPTPTFARLDDEDRKEAFRHYEEFVTWVYHAKGLEDLIRDPNACEAIAQHYSLPTMLLDFSTEPGIAGYFAASIGNKKRDEPGCIYCLNTKKLSDLWSTLRKIRPDTPDLEFIDNKVPNLWRLEAQHGVFLMCPAGWDNYFPMDRILFPQSGELPFPTKEHVYPSKKSQLELLLDHYFFEHENARFHEALNRAFPKMTVIRDKGPKGGFYPQYFVAERLPLLVDWRPKKLTEWLRVPVEAFSETALGEIELAVQWDMAPAVLREKVAFGVRRALKLNPLLRSKSVRWSMLPQRRLSGKLREALDWLWNGMRLLPLSSESIADGIGLCFALHKLGYSRVHDRDKQQNLVAKCLDRPMRVEFSSIDGGSYSGFASTSDLAGAVRHDIESRVNSSHRHSAKDPYVLLQWCMNPRRLFSFQSLAHLFATQIAPTQVLQEGAYGAVFSPARLQNFGLP